MKKNPEGTLVVELNHRGIPDEELKPEAFSEHQLAVLAALNPADQEKIRKGYPITVVDMESQATLADFNMKNIRPDKWQMESLARALLPQIQEFYKDPENVKKAAAWAEERKKKQKPNRK